MKRRLLVMAIGLNLAGLSAPQALASGDIATCGWGTPDCTLMGTPWLDANNDTRDNLLRLISARKGFALPLAALPADDRTSRDAYFGYHDVPYMPDSAGDDAARPAPADPNLTAALKRVGITAPLPVTAGDAESADGRFVSNSPESAAAFINALADDASVHPTRRHSLAAARLALLAKGDAFTGSHSVLRPGFTLPGQAGEFRRYLGAAEAFYQGNYPQALSGFSALSAARQPWVAETARYMVMRTRLNQSTQQATDQYGLFDLQRIHQDSAAAALAAAQDYLAHYPDGQYAGATHGMLRRIYWYLQRPADQAPLYQQALDKAADAEALEALVVETDSKLQSQSAMGGASFSPTAGAPLLNFTEVLRDLRLSSQQQPEAKNVSESSLTGLAPLLASSDYPGLAEYLHQAWRYWQAHDYAALVADIRPDYALKDNDVLGFSRQILYGAGLMGLKRWDEAERHWRLLLAHEKGERAELVQMKLAATLVSAKRLDVLLAPDSPVTNLRLRSLALKTLASPRQLRQQVADGRNPEERTIALHTLLMRDLQAGRYGQWLADRKSEAKINGKVNSETFADVNLAVFNWQGHDAEPGYRCPALVPVIQTLAATPHAPAALNCLGEFARLTGAAIDITPESGGNDAFDAVVNDPLAQLPIDRQAAYRQVIADPKASREDRSFALYRAVRCYAPSGNNDCGGEPVSKATRKQWFTQLKQRYPDSPWAAQLKYYW